MQHGRTQVFWVVAWIAVASYLAWTLFRMAMYPSLTSFADDSSNYLVMALHYSPWVPASPAIQAAWPLQYHPPLFPLLLAGTGAAHSFLAAHLITLVLGAAAIVLFWRFSLFVLGDTTWAMVLTMLFPFLPGFLLGMQGILSESLYLLLTIGFLLSAKREEPHPGVRIATLSLLVATLLTRSFGVVLVGALIARAVFDWKHSRAIAKSDLKLAVGAMLIFVALHLLLMPGGKGEYGGILQGMVRNGGELGWAGLSQYLLGQGTNLLDSWASFFLIYWRPGSPLFWVLLGLLATACAGLVMRLRQNQLDAWYVLGSLALLMAWPFPGQMLRFLFPLVPLLLLHAAWAIKSVGQRAQLAGGAACLLLLVAVLPVHAFIQGRLSAAEQLGLVPVYEWLRKPDYPFARQDLEVQNAMLGDFARLRESTSTADVVAYFEPSYVALLAGRKSIPLAFPPDFSVAGRDGATVILLTRLHPRMTREGLDALAAPAAPPPSWCGTGPITHLPTTCLFRLDRADVN